MKAENVKPIRSKKVLREVQDTLLHNFKYGMRNYTIFQVGKATMLRVSDVLRLKRDDVFNSKGQVNEHVSIHDKKTGKLNILYLKPVKKNLKDYYKWLKKNKIESQWLFPNFMLGSTADEHVKEKQFYLVMRKVGDLLSIDYLGTNTMRKTGAYTVYKKTNNIALVMHLLNHSSEAMTLHYLGLDKEATEKALDMINFD